VPTFSRFALAPSLVAGTRLVALVPGMPAMRLGALAGTNVADPLFPASNL
jgi:hypothetical protein